MEPVKATVPQIQAGEVLGQGVIILSDTQEQLARSRVHFGNGGLIVFGRARRM